MAFGYDTGPGSVSGIPTCALASQSVYRVTKGGASTLHRSLFAHVRLYATNSDQPT